MVGFNYRYDEGEWSDDDAEIHKVRFRYYMETHVCRPDQNQGMDNMVNFSSVK